jgi:hypothetical protein
MALTLGSSRVGPEWTAGQLKRGWSLYRDEVMGGPRSAGSRPWAWWEFEAHEPKPEREADEALALFRLGVLGPDEMLAVAGAGARVDRVRRPGRQCDDEPCRGGREHARATSHGR